MSRTIIPKWPKDYLKLEREYCAEAIKYFEISTGDFKSIHRGIVLDKRKTFRKIWNETHKEKFEL